MRVTPVLGQEAVQSFLVADDFPVSRTRKMPLLPRFGVTVPAPAVDSVTRRLRRLDATRTAPRPLDESNRIPQKIFPNSFQNSNFRGKSKQTGPHAPRRQEMLTARKFASA